MPKIQFSYLVPAPDKSVKFYQLKNTMVSREFLENLQDVNGLPYYEDSDGGLSLFLDGQHSYRKIQNILERTKPQ